MADYLRAEAIAQAGDPGPVVLRRLGNAEYTYTIEDLTGVDLRPAREFPADGAAGEGFTNTGNALVMSPALLSKYLDAAKKIAGHAVLLPDGIRFSAGGTRRDWTDETLARIRGFYSRFTDSGGGTQVNLQGIVFGTNDGGRLPLEKYLAATLSERTALASRSKTIAAVARERGLNAKYLGICWSTLSDTEPAPILDDIRKRWREAGAHEAHAVASEIVRWQKELWQFASVGHIGKVGGPKAWMEPLTPIVERQELRLKMPAAGTGDVTLYLVAGDAGDGNDHDHVVWERPRLVAPGRPELLLRDVRDVAGRLTALRDRAFATTARCLSAAANAGKAPGRPELEHLARSTTSSPRSCRPGSTTSASAPPAPTPGSTVSSQPRSKRLRLRLRERLGLARDTQRHRQFVRQGGAHPRRSRRRTAWPCIPRRPSASQRAGRARSSAVIEVKARVRHAHPECGNGVTYSLELKRGAVRQRLASGIAHGAKEVLVGPFVGLAVQPADLISVAIGPRDGNHACDLTVVDLTVAGGGREWDLARDVSPDILAGNPHADRLGNADVWHFYTEPDRGSAADNVVPAGSLLARWQSAAQPAEKERLAQALQNLLTNGPPTDKNSADALLYRQLASLRGPLFSAVVSRETGTSSRSALKRLTTPLQALTRRSSAGTRAARRSRPPASACKRRTCSKCGCRPSWWRAASLSPEAPSTRTRGQPGACSFNSWRALRRQRAARRRSCR